jgi:hypothetical protein
LEGWCGGGNDCGVETCGRDGCCIVYCNNGVQDGTETDVDCGGNCQAFCRSGQHCSSPLDCYSNTCLNGVCQ